MICDPHKTQRCRIVHLDVPDEEALAVSRALLAIVCGLVAASGFAVTYFAWRLW